jgi:tetratricopeptide (TPR) repeat protein
MLVVAVRHLEAAHPRLARPAAGGQRPLALVGAVLAIGFVVVFGWRGHARAAIWKTAYGLMGDAELHYPNGTAAKTRQARRAALEGDVETAVAALRAAYARGYNRLDHLLAEPAYAPLRSDPRFAALLEEIAIEWRDRLGAGESPSQIELRALAQALIVLEDYRGAVEALERAQKVGGPIGDAIEGDLENVRRALRIQQFKRDRATGS